MSEYVYGRNTVKLLLSEHPKRVFKVLGAEGLSPDKRAAIAERDLQRVMKSSR